MRRISYFAVMISGLLVWYVPYAQATLYGVTFANHQLININQSTGAGALVGTISETDGSELASFGGNLYAFDQAGSGGSGTFSLINPATAGTISTTIAGAFVAGEGGMSFRSDGLAFLSNSQGTSGQLLQCNVSVNNGCSVVAPLSVSLDGLAFDASNVLYGLSQSPVGDPTPSLYTVNQTTGTETLIGATGLAGVNLAGLAFDPTSQVLYAAIGTDLYTVNLATGAPTLIGNTGFGTYAGLAFVTTSIPEPASIAVLGTSLLCFGLLRRRIRGGADAAT